jgi:hypothetical protein
MNSETPHPTATASVHTARIAVLVPCYNEEAAIAAVVKDFRTCLPGAEIYVYDNNSRDQTFARAEKPVPSSGAKPVRAKAMWCAGCSPTSRPIFISWSMATTRMTPAPRRASPEH